MTDPRALDALPTEGRLPAARELDRLSTREQVALMLEQDRAAVDAVAAAGEAIATAVEAVAARLGAGGRLLYVGAGTPGRLGLLDAAEVGPTFGLPPGRVLALMAGGSVAMGQAREQGEDDAAAGRADLDRESVVAGDAVVGVSASGRTPYTLAALERAEEVGALTVAVVATPDSPMAAVARHPIETLTGAEVVSGSTRLKAGTAQKLVLNALSTLTMVRLGHTFGDLMVDVAATNEKLRRRAQRIVAEATGADDAAVAAALQATSGEAKPAIVSLLADIDAGEARRRLDAAGGRVRDAIEPGP